MILLCYQEQYNWLAMNGVGHKLQELSTWFQLNKIEIQEYIKRYPFVQFKQMQASNIFKNKLGQVISLIVVQIVPITSGHPKVKHFSRNLHQNSGVINNLCALKKNLEQIKYAFLGLDDLKKYSIALIQNILQESISLANLKKSVLPKGQKMLILQNTKGLSFQTKHRQLYQEKLSFWKEKYSYMNEKDRTQKVRAEIYAQMNEFLANKEKSIQQKREKRIFSQHTTEQYKYLDNQAQSVKYRQNKQRKRIFLNDYQNSEKIQKQGPNAPKKQQNPRKKFKYLEDLDKASIQPQFEQTWPLQTPINRIKQFLPSTAGSNVKQEQSELQRELSKFQVQKQIESSIKMQLNFDYLLSKLRQDQKNENEQQGWQKFDQDSIEKENEQNFEDSLEIMKASEGLDNTAHFGCKQSKISQKEDHQYSFSNL